MQVQVSILALVISFEVWHASAIQKPHASPHTACLTNGFVFTVSSSPHWLGPMSIMHGRAGALLHTFWVFLCFPFDTLVYPVLKGDCSLHALVIFCASERTQPSGSSFQAHAHGDLGREDQEQHAYNAGLPRSAFSG